MKFIDVAPSFDDQAARANQTEARRRLISVAVACLAVFGAPAAEAQGNAPRQQWTDGQFDVELPTVTVSGRSLDSGWPTGARRPGLGGSGKGGGGGSGGGGGGGGAGADPGKEKRPPPPPKDNSKEDDCATGSNPTSGNPVVIATGEKIKPEPDFSSFGMYGLSHGRTYRSAAIGRGMFGPYWWSSLAHNKLARWGCVKSQDYGCMPTTVQVWNPDGSSDIYSHVAGTEYPFEYTASGSASGGTVRYYPT